ncbi:speckle-type POZ protein-like [Saccostrea echinata]|uniref:speckle-type POZ protein-like n=1 Tax=Saccostrea echinata TaxID=191078 RepID=UPI002A81065A|nr:speckle-type POZ protein-like [Saccostrea echinata]
MSKFEEEPGVTDLVLIVEGRRIYVTKAILMHVSPVFKTMFTSDFKEKRQQEIQLPGKKYDNFVLFLAQIYPGERPPLTGDVLTKILPYVDEYQVDYLKKDCQNILLQSLEVSKGLRYLLDSLYIATTYGFQQLYQKALHHLRFFSLDSYKESSIFKRLPSETKLELAFGRCRHLERKKENYKKRLRKS